MNQVQVFGPARTIREPQFLITAGGKTFACRHPSDEELLFHLRRPDPRLLASRVVMSGEQVPAAAAKVISEALTVATVTGVVRTELTLDVMLSYAGGCRTSSHVLEIPPPDRLLEILVAMTFPERSAETTLLSHWQRLLVRVEGYRDVVPVTHKLAALKACVREVAMEKTNKAVELI